MAPSGDSLGFDQGELSQESVTRDIAFRIEQNHHSVIQLYCVRVSDDASEYKVYPWRHSERADFVDDPDHTMWALVRWDDNQRRWTAPMGPVKEWQDEMVHLPPPTKEDFAALAAREEELRERSQL